MIDNNLKTDVILFWESEDEFSTLTEVWSYYQPFIFTRINNEEKP